MFDLSSTTRVDFYFYHFQYFANQDINPIPIEPSVASKTLILFLGYFGIGPGPVETCPKF